MAPCSPSKSSPSGPMGDSLSRNDAKQDALSCPGFLLLNYRKSWDPHVFHGGLAYTILVWIYKSR